MTLAIVHTRAGLGLEAPEVQVEITHGLGLSVFFNASDLAFGCSGGPARRRQPFFRLS